MGTTLIIVDPQHDFIDNWSMVKPALAVPGSEQDMNNVIDLLDFHGAMLDRIVIPLDQHPPNHVAHAVMWVDRNGRHPDPYTNITAADVKAGVWMASLPQNQVAQAAYVEAAEAAGVSLIIWPDHCIIGSKGATIYEPLMDTLAGWWRPDRELLLFPKSGYWCSEQFSSLRAAVPVKSEPSTLYNSRMRDAMIDDNILVAGEALGHCVAATLRDLIHGDGMENPAMPHLASQITLLRDCTSNVADTEDRGAAFLDEFQALGGRVARSTEVFPDTLDDSAL